MKKEKLGTPVPSGDGSNLRVASSALLAGLGLLANASPASAITNTHASAADDQFGTQPNTQLQDSVTSNDTYPCSGNVLSTLELISAPIHGNLANTFGALNCTNPANVFGAFTYTPNEDFAGQDSFQYRINVAGGGTSSNVVTATIYVADAPSAPQELRGQATNSFAFLSFLPPANAGDAPILDYEYSLNGGNTYTSLGITSPPALVELSGGTSGVEILLRADNIIGPGDPATIDLDQTLEDDTDTVANAVEDAVPDPDGSGTGDGNGDGTADSGQTNVTSLPTDDGEHYITLESEPGITISGAIAEPTPDDFPTDLGKAPFSGVSFILTGLDPGGTATVALYVPKGKGVTGLVKKNKDTGEWDEIPTTITTVGDKRRIEFTIDDGGSYDLDSVDGQITDPVYPLATPQTHGLGVKGGGLPLLTSLPLLLAALSRRLRRR